MADAAVETDSEGAVCTLNNRQVVDRILTFVEEFTRATRVGKANLYTYQKLFARRIVESVILNDGDTVTALFSRQSGKTETVANVAIGLAVILPVLCREFPGDDRFKPFSAGFWVGIFAPILDQSGISFGRMRGAVNSEVGQELLNDPELAVRVTTDRGDTIAFSNGSVVRAKSASPDTNIEGKTYHLVIIDEAQKVLRSKVEKEITPMLAATNGTMVKIGTAWESRGGFHTDIQYNIEKYRQGGPRNHYEFDYLMVQAEKKSAHKRDANPFHLNYEKFVSKTIRRLGGTDNEEFKMNFELKWSESRVIAFKPAVLMAGRDSVLGLNLPRIGGLQVAGLDVAKDNDSSVLTVMWVNTEAPIVDVSKIGTPHDRAGDTTGEDEQNLFYMKVIVGLLELQGTFEGDSGQYNTVVNFLRQYSVNTFLVDATGMGDPVYERFTVLLPDVEVHPFKYNIATKSDLYKYYLQEWYARRIKYPADKEALESPFVRRFESQHIDLDKLSRGSYVTCEAPEGEHDDYPDSAALATFAERMVKKESLPEVEVTQVPGGPRSLGPSSSQIASSGSSRYRMGRGGRR